MPPKARINKEEIAIAAVELIRCGKSVTAAAIGKKLHCSTQPVFWYYESMEDVIAAAFYLSHKKFSEFLRQPMESLFHYKETGLRYIQFAREEPELFRLLFMSDRSKEDMLSTHPDVPFIIGVIREDSCIDEVSAMEICRVMWLFVHGIATMIVSTTVRIEDDEVSRMLSEVYRGLLYEKCKN